MLQEEILVALVLVVEHTAELVLVVEHTAELAEEEELQQGGNSSRRSTSSGARSLNRIIIVMDILDMIRNCSCLARLVWNSQFALHAPCRFGIFVAVRIINALFGNHH
jgi:hypothetical protein